MSTVSPAAVSSPGGGRPLRLSRGSDELLARLATRGSDRAFAALYERYSQPIYRYCSSIVRNENDAQDALQSTFTSALTALRRDARNAPLRPWLYRIAHNESISLLRRRKRDVPHEEVPEPAALGSSAEEEAAGRARWRVLLGDLAELPERQRGALLLRELAGLSHEDIAVALGLSVGGAKQAIFEARQALAEVEEGRAMSCDEVRLRVSEGDRRVLRGRLVRSHLRDCVGCEAFALAIPARRSDLRALVPALPPAAAASVLRGVIQTASSHGGASAGIGSAVAASAVGKMAGTAVVWKALAAAALVATAAAGVTGLTHVLHYRHAAGGARSHTPARPVKLAAAARTGNSGVRHHLAAGPGAGHHRGTRGSARPVTIHRTFQHHGANSAPAPASVVPSLHTHGAATHHSGASSAVGHSRSAAHAPSIARGRSRAHAPGHVHIKTLPAARSQRSVHSHGVKSGAGSPSHSGGTPHPESGGGGQLASGGPTGSGGGAPSSIGQPTRRASTGAKH